MRQRDSAFRQLNDRAVFGARLRLSSSASQVPRLDAPVDLNSPPHSPTVGSLTVPDSPTPMRRRDADIAERKLPIYMRVILVRY